MQHLKQLFNAMLALIVMAFTSLSSASPTEIPKKNSGIIHFMNDKNEEKCTLAVPESSQYFDFGSNNQYCENNMVSSFWLENVPSATLINFHAEESCTDAQSKQNFYIKFKTVKQSTDWGTQANAISIDSLRNLGKGWLIPKKHIRIESFFLGSDFNTKSLNEQLSCVYIERSQPVN